MCRNNHEPRYALFCAPRKRGAFFVPKREQLYINRALGQLLSFFSKISVVIRNTTSHTQIMSMQHRIIELKGGIAMDYKINKGLRLLNIYERLKNGQVLNKEQLAAEFDVSPKSIQRDMDDLRAYAEETEVGCVQILYDRTENGYRLIDERKSRLTNPEVLSLSKILLESRAFTKDEMSKMLDKLIDFCVPEQDKKAVLKLISNECHNYIQPQHGVSLTDRLWDISQAVSAQKLMQITYTKLKNKQTVTRTVQPVGIMFSEFYFYLLAFIVDDNTHEPIDSIDDLYPTIYRIDRIEDFKVLNKTFRVAYADRFQEGEFRKRVQFMFGGKLQTVKFLYKGLSVESVLDRLPTAKAEPHPDGTYTITAEVFGNGIEMWLRSQGENVEIIVEKIKEN